MTDEQLTNASHDDLIQIIKKLLAEVASLKEQLRKSHRQASPFSKGKPKANPKKPGRRAGKGAFTRRPAPEVTPSDQVEDLAAPLSDKLCPYCGVPLDVDIETATTIDIPEEPVRRIKRFAVEVGLCPLCGMKVRGTHPDLARGQHGATAHRVGTNLQAQALAIHYDSGLPLRKVPAAIGSLTGIHITQGALTQLAEKLCREQGAVGDAYQGLRKEVRQAPVVNTDDTGWRTGGQPSYLMGFFTPVLAVYQIRDRHRHQEVLEMLGDDFDGKLGTDRGKSYEAEALDHLDQQKCLSHLLKNLSEVEETKTGRAKSFTRELKVTLRQGLELWQQHTRGEISIQTYRRRGKIVEETLTTQLRDRKLSDADNQRMLNGIGMQHERGRVLLFLKHPEVEPTNNRAERGLRGGVIARKVSHCSKNRAGARTYEAMKSIVATLAARGYNVAKGLASIIKGNPMPLCR